MNPFFSQIIGVIQEKLTENHIPSCIIPVSANEEWKTLVIQQIKNQPHKGIIYSAGFYQSQQEWIDLYNEIQVPLVLMNTDMAAPGIACLKINFHDAFSTTIQHLFELGHRQIAFLGDLEYEFAIEESAGIEKSLQQHGLSNQTLNKISVSHTAEGASQGVARIMMIPEKRSSNCDSYF
ncbi:MAG: hypothetical protein AB9907_01110 [Flexilinea sp.]